MHIIKETRILFWSDICCFLVTLVLVPKLKTKYPLVDSLSYPFRSGLDCRCLFAQCVFCGNLIKIKRYASLSDNSNIKLSNGNDAALVEDSAIGSKGQAGKYTGRRARFSFVRRKWCIFILIRLVQSGTGYPLKYCFFLNLA